MDDAPFVPVGRIIKVHGVHGELSVALRVTDYSTLPDHLMVWVVPPVPALGATRIISVRPGPKGPLVQLDAVSDRSQAEQLRGRTLVARRCDLPDDWLTYPPQYGGFEVHDTVRGPLGTVTDTIETGANDVWVVDHGPYGQVLVPVIDDVVVTIDDERRVVTVRLLPGLLDRDGAEL
ncbi:MAG TPA: ribosome maturation factor RimM [Coriobacteriia bacterium]|nr:ribosome maturation factor RimM [Coriobacteriia bacterium]